MEKYYLLFYTVLSYKGESEMDKKFKDAGFIVKSPILYDTFEQAKEAAVKKLEDKIKETSELIALYEIQLAHDIDKLTKAKNQVI
jgi:hypothetical protein